MKTLQRHVGWAAVGSATLHLLLAATSGGSSVGAIEKPARNIYGTLTDIENNFVPFEYLAVGSRTMTNNIPVYTEPGDLTIAPTTNTTYIDLTEIASIALARSESPSDNLIKFKDTEYVRILINFKSNPSKEHPYLVESKTNIYCDEDINPQHKVPRALRFNAIKKITISGFRSADRNESAHGAPHKKAAPFDQKKFHTCSQAQQTLQQLSEEAKQLPSQQQDAIIRLVDNAKDLVGGICNN